MRKLICIAAVAAAALASCGSSKVASDVAALNGEWTIVKVEGKTITKEDCENVPFLGFETAKKNLYGNTGCNMFTGSLAGDLKNGKIDFSQTGTTQMLCADMKVEGMVLEALKKSKKYTINNNEMTLNDNGGNVVVVLKKTK